VRLHIEGAITSRSVSTSDPWEIVLAGPARKSLERVPSPDRERIEAILKEMAIKSLSRRPKAPQGTAKDISPAGRCVAHILFPDFKRKTHRRLGY